MEMTYYHPVFQAFSFQSDSESAVDMSLLIGGGGNSISLFADILFPYFWQSRDF